MNEYKYNQTKDIFHNLKSGLKLDNSLRIQIIKAILVPIVIYFIIYNFISPKSAGFAIFVFAGTMVGLVISILSISSTLKKIKSITKIQWNNDKIVFISNENIIKQWKVKNIELIQKSEDMLYLKMKSFTKIDYMAIPLNKNTPSEFIEFYNKNIIRDI